MVAVRNRVPGALLAWAVLVAGVVLIGAAALRPGAAPATVAIVDVFRLIDGLQEAKDLKAQLDERFKAVQKQFDQTRIKLEAMEADYIAMKADDPLRRDKFFELRKAREFAKAEAESVEAVFNLEGGDAMSSLYDRVLDAVRRLAARDGYDLVLLDDRSRKLPEQGNDSQMRAGIYGRKILYAAEPLDITPTVIAMMNTDYAARQ